MLTMSILFFYSDSENFMYFNLDLVNLRVLSMKLAESLCRIFFFFF
ncbi:rCG57762 [Rattus norvegicus]|uniref:RCG57762 n=1 Tax=Rattus norvegicus TaxID=10116 RepID=A6JHJ4_RAT|nr:rCG57762 [Rattus norvegicus]